MVILGCITKIIKRHPKVMLQKLYNLTNYYGTRGIPNAVHIEPVGTPYAWPYGSGGPSTRVVTPSKETKNGTKLNTLKAMVYNLTDHLGVGIWKVHVEDEHSNGLFPRDPDKYL